MSYHTRVLSRTLRATPVVLILVCALFFGAAYFAVRFPDVPGSSTGSYLSTVLIALPAVVALWTYLGAHRTLAALSSVSLFGYAVEMLGVATGFPYGTFYYGDALGPKLFGLVPYILPISYAPLVVGAVAALHGQRLLPSVLKSSALLVLIDAVLDPGATALGFWRWPEGGAYYGVPLSNYLGWLLSGALASALLLHTGRAAWRKDSPPPGSLDSVLIALAFWGGVAVFSGLAVPSSLGVVLFVYLIHRRYRLRADFAGQV